MRKEKGHIFVPIIIVLLLIFNGCKDTSTDKTEEEIDGGNTIAKYSDRFSYLLEYPIDSIAFPRSADANGVIKRVPSKDWTSGFFPGSLWNIYRLTDDTRYRDRAKEWTAFIEKEKYNDKTHDMGFKVFCSFGNGYKILNDPTYKDIIIASAKTLSTRYNDKIGAIRSWDFNKEEWQFPVIIDNMMNLELLFEASKYSQDQRYHDIAEQHAKTTLKNHFRTDNSSYHVVDYDTITGHIRSKVTHQGFGKESSWARGQAWGLYGYTMAYRYTKSTEFLEQAKKIATFLIHHNRLPEDGIPYWDFDAPKIPKEPRDASAAAIIASAMIELYEYTTDKKYLEFSDKIMSSLSSENYVIQDKTEVPFILNHSTGNWPKNDEINGPISYADYYFLEAILRRKALK
ncbi:glycoside hydrolase family 88 protein [uncultured Aquimarina sp.]|uniref:glycoside hydrolase family 88 protein n=1 Tax=uncultured Aquimarina sp. TaxID=575652 RepID=UPI002602B798|nr:glycoside hydrolase family 88 protein [uncultured Aquimarina sp.]